MIVKRLQAFKFELRPNGAQARLMRRFAGSCRFVFNEALALQKARYERGEKKLGYAGLCKELTAWRNGAPLPSGRIAPWLAEAPVHPLQQTLNDLERAYANFFAKRADFPKFKKKGRLECGFAENADLVGAINILSRGMQMLRDEGQDTTNALVGRNIAARIACEVNGVVMPSAAGTHRSNSGAAQCRA